MCAWHCLAFCFISCGDAQETHYVLIGDSLCEHWNVNYYLLVMNIENRGIAGMKIEDCRTKIYNVSSCSVILLVGTNDVTFTDEKKVPEVCERYMNLVRDIQTERIYCISLLPKARQYSSVIKSFNRSVSEQLKACGHATYVDVYDAFEHDGELNPNYTTDGLHLNYKGYELLSALLLRSIQ
ncbi:GDSL-type esterase/lipase family protein [Palleniella intestinalis]|jgi:Lysophospholipase L1 and related esterases|uniref:GDSL-type esterase/lipase family protein n=1 Tax=Palleniella intestinalis TaxID=2736291 RepID=UPI00350F6D92